MPSNKRTSKNLVLLGALLLVGAEGARASSEKDYPRALKKPPLAREEVKSQEIKAGAGAGAEEEATKAKAETKTADAALHPGTSPLGPRKGIVRDAGRFKVELRTKNNGIDVFLVNQQESAPVIDASDIEGQLYVGEQEFELRFRPQRGQAKFFAPWPDKLKLEEKLQGKEVSVVLLPTRERIIGAPVLYKLERFY